MQRTAISSLIISLFLSLPLMAEKKATLAVLDFVGNNVSSADAAILRNRIEVQFFQSGLVRVLERESFRKKIVQQNIGSMACSDTECAVRIARFIYADFVVIGSVDRIDGYTLHLRLVNATTGTIDTVISESFSSRKELFQVKETESVKLLKPIRDGDYINGSEPIKRYHFSFSAFSGYALPLGTLRKKSEHGCLFSSTADFTYRNILFSLQADYIGLVQTDGSFYASLVPLIAATGYTIHLGDYYIAPRIGGGLCYNRIHGSSSGAFEGIVFSKLSFGYTLGGFNILLFTDYRYIVENNSPIHLLSFGLGARLTI